MGNLNGDLNLLGPAKIFKKGALRNCKFVILSFTFLFYIKHELSF
jgi:hypothetical protein